MRALVLEQTKSLTIREMDIYRTCGADDARIAIRNVGICGSDIHYYLHGAIGEYVVREPMVLGHEASGIVVEAGKHVTDLRVGDRVCMEPGIPENSKVTGLGLYNLDPGVRFWATPPVHGCLCESVVHPASFTHKIPDHVSFEEGAMVEPLAIGLQAASKARIAPGDTALVTGCGTIGILTALSALAGGCSKVFISDINSEKLSITKEYKNIIPIDAAHESPFERIMKETDGWGVEKVFEATGSSAVYRNIHELASPGGCLVLVGIPAEGSATFSITGLQSKELSTESVFRSAHKYERAIRLIASGDIDVKPLISAIYPFDQSIAAYESASSSSSQAIKVQISMEKG